MLLVVLVQTTGFVQVFRSISLDLFKPTIPIEERGKVGSVLRDRYRDLRVVSGRGYSLTEPLGVVNIDILFLL
jgi:hypothetical protein